MRAAHSRATASGLPLQKARVAAGPKLPSLPSSTTRAITLIRCSSELNWNTFMAAAWIMEPVSVLGDLQHSDAS